MKARSGQAFGEIKSPTALSGPAFCWYHLVPDVGERVEVQIYRIKRLGELNLETNRYVVGLKNYNSTTKLYFSIINDGCLLTGKKMFSKFLDFSPVSFTRLPVYPLEKESSNLTTLK